jgi:hypothetical protein
VRGAEPAPLEPVADAPEHYNVVVMIAPGGRERLGEVPYRTTVVEWELERGEGTAAETLEKLYEDVAVRVRDLMTTLAGPDAR